jgi:peroxiredoxin
MAYGFSPGRPFVTDDEVSPSLIGSWRGEFELKPGVKVPFNFEIQNKDNKLAVVYFLNADEKYEGGLVRQKNDSLFFVLNQFDNEMLFKINGNELSGVLKKQGTTTFSTPVTAKKNLGYRFKKINASPERSISGTYDIVFKSTTGEDEKAVGLFEQEGGKLKGTFLRVTGDSRYLEGVVDGHNFQLSSFIGSSPAYYRGTVNEDGTIAGEIVGARSSQHFTGVPNENAALPDPYKLTFLKNGYNTLDFSFPDADGKLVSSKDKKFQNKVVIITITGSWCPNCADEASFLAPWYKANKGRGIEAIAIHYERQTDPAFVKKVLSRFKEKHGITYQQVFAGKADKQGVAASLPALNAFLSFPTTILIDKKGKVAKIHTGFSGPATGKYYEDFIKEFNQDVDKLINE